MNKIKNISENTVETLWESEEKNHNGDSFITIKKSRGYYVYAERLGKDSIAFVLYDKKTQKFGLIKESKPPLDGEDFRTYLVTAFGGSIDMDAPNQKICQIEVEEESGYKVPLKNIVSIDKTFVSSQMSQICELFVVDMTGIPKTKIAEWEESKTLNPNEERLIWMSKEEVLDNGDWKSVFIMAHMEYKNIL